MVFCRLVFLYVLIVFTAASSVIKDRFFVKYLWNFSVPFRSLTEMNGNKMRERGRRFTEEMIPFEGLIWSAVGHLIENIYWLEQPVLPHNNHKELLPAEVEPNQNGTLCSYLFLPR